MPTGLGVDVHPYYQRGARFDGVEYAWLKMADGAAVYAKKVNGVWYTADEHARLLRLQRTPFGGYVYAQPGDGAAEARVLWGECERLGGTGVAPACDIESDPDIHVWSKAEATDHGRAFCSWFRGRGIRPAIYMNASLAQLTRPDLWPEDPVIWIARYGFKPEVLANGVQYTGRYDVHQYRQNGSLPGSAGAVDWNQSYSAPGKTPGTAHLITATEEPDMDATQAKQLAELHAWLSPLSVETGPKPANGDAPRSNPKTINDMLANLYGMMFFPSNYIAAPDGGRMPSILSMVAKAAYGSGVDPAAIANAVEQAVGQGLEEFRTQLRADVVSVIGEDNAEQADAIVDKLAARLGTKPAVTQ